VLKRPLVLIAALLLILLFSWFLRPTPAAEVARTALIMGTLVEIKGVGSDEKSIEGAISDAFNAMRAEEARFSVKIETSQISAINRATESIEVEPQVIALLQLGQRITRQAAGAFHMGLGSLKQLWNFEAVTPKVPELSEIKAALPISGGDMVSISGTRVKRTATSLQLDLGGIAKGYAVDRALDVLRTAGLESASVNAGGDIGLLGGHAERPWKIGIQHPRKAGELLATIELSDRAIVTSGDYERFFMLDGVRYHHIFDPQTGLPARDCQSVSVVAPTAAEADALATAVFVLGPRQGLALLEKTQDVEGLIVSATGEVEISSGLKDQIQWR
jgi:thiamine biosynthesis lipoprotein